MAQYADPTVVSITSNSINPGAFVVLAAGIAAALFAGVFLVQIMRAESQTSDLKQSIVKDQNQLAQLKPTAQKLEEYNSLVTNLKTLFDQQKLSGDLLSQIESRLYRKMKVTALQVSDTGMVDLTGATTDYVEYAKIYSSLDSQAAKDTFSTVRVVSVSKTQTKEGDSSTSQVNFTFRLTLTPQTLEKASSSAQL